MEIPFAVVADDATVSIDNKLTINGIFDTIHAREFPALVPRMVFVFSLRAEFEDSEQEFDLRVRLVDEDGGRIFQGDTHLGVPRIEPGQRKTINQVFRLQMVGFQRAGSYKFIVEARRGEDGPPDLTSETPFTLDLIAS